MIKEFNSFDDLSEEELNEVSDEEIEEELRKHQPKDVYWAQFSETKVISYALFDASSGPVQDLVLENLRKQVSAMEILYFQNSGLKTVPFSMLPHQVVVDIRKLDHRLLALVEEMESHVEYRPVSAVIRFYEDFGEGFTPVQSELPLEEE